MTASYDFKGTALCQRFLEALQSNFDDLFDEVTDKTPTEDTFYIIRTFYYQVSAGKRSTDQPIGNSVQNWTAYLKSKVGAIPFAHFIY